MKVSTLIWPWLYISIVCVPIHVRAMHVFMASGLGISFYDTNTKPPECVDIIRRTS